VRPVSVEDESKEEGAATDLPKNFLRALTFREFNSYLVTHGSGTNVEAEVSILVYFHLKTWYGSKMNSKSAGLVRTVDWKKEAYCKG
jgi:hypothetical protein